MKKIMIVDDAMFVRHSLKMMLENNGFSVVGEASNGKEAIAMYTTLKPDIVTMDITMPELDGLEALKAIRKLDPSSKVIMITAMGQERHVKEAVIEGARGFIVKPFKEDRVVQALNEA